MPHSDEVPVPVFDHLPSLENEVVIMEDVPDFASDPDYADVPSTEPKSFNQSELNDLVRDLGLSKELSDFFGF